MECPYCNAELRGNGSYGSGNMAAQEKYGYGWEKTGELFICPNAESFDTEEEATTYLEEINETLENLGLDSWEELTCDSNTHHVSGSFYTDSYDNLKEGYPC